MSKLEIIFHNPLKTTIRNESGKELATDAPKIHGGIEHDFGPTDLVAAALGSCILTIMGVQAAKLGIDLEGTELFIEKIMTISAPRRIGKFIIEIKLPHKWDEEIEAKLKEAVHNCPVYHSLHPDIVIEKRVYAAQKSR